jgi:hypothetical protein
MWEQAIAANPDWILVTSWNEWHEGSEIEPSLELGDRELKTTKQFARKFASMKPRHKTAAGLKVGLKKRRGGWRTPRLVL